jgi:hypothetical protein
LDFHDQCDLHDLGDKSGTSVVISKLHVLALQVGSFESFAFSPYKSPIMGECFLHDAIESGCRLGWIVSTQNDHQ